MSIDTPSESFLTRDYRRYFVASLSAHTAFQMQMVVIGWHVLERTDSAVWVGVVAGAYSLPMLLLAALVGALADRSRRQTIIVGALAVGAITITLVSLLIARDIDAPWHLLIASFVLGATFTFYAPARLALLPNLLPSGALLRASTVEYASTRVVGFFGPLAAGALVEATGVARTLLLQSGLFVLALFVYANTGRHIVTIPDPTKGAIKVLRGIRDALSSLRTDRPLFALFVLSVLVVPIGMAYLKLLPVFARDVVGAGPTVLGAMVGVVSFGTAVSGFALAALGHRLRKGPAVLISSLAYSGVLVVLSTTRDVPTAMAALAALGLLAGVFLTLTNVLLQSRVVDTVRGRIMAIYGMVWGLVPMVTFVAGVAAERFGVAPVIGGLGTLCALCCVAVAVRNPVLMDL